MTALPPEADIKLNLGKRSANDPKQTVSKCAVSRSTDALWHWITIGAALRDRLSSVDSAFLSGMGASAVMIPVGVGCATCADLEYSSIYGGQLEVRLSQKLH